MADQRIASTEEMVGSGHATKADTLNRLALIDHGTDGQHTLAGFQGSQYAADAEASDTYVVTLDPVPAAYFAGMVVNFKANTVNTGAATLNVNALGAKTIKKNVSDDLADGDIPAGTICTVVYDGTNFQLIGPMAGEASVLVQVQHASIATLVSGNTQIPNDNTIPQSNEGFEVLTCAITPKSATNRLLILGSVTHSTNDGTGSGLAVFQDSTAGALAAVMGFTNSQLHITKEMAAGTTSETTFKLRFGPMGATKTHYVNAIYGSTTVAFGGVASTTLTILEFTPAA